jgi:hypothetical protein
MVRWIAIAVVALGVGQAEAQTPNNVLEGLSTIRLKISGVDAADQACGLTEEGLRSAAMYPLSASRLAVTPVAEASFTVEVTTLHPPNGCVGHISIEVGVVRFIRTFSGNERIVDVRLWHDGSILTSSSGDYTQQVLNIIERKTKVFLTDWNLDNKAGR